MSTDPAPDTTLSAEDALRDCDECMGACYGPPDHEGLIARSVREMNEYSAAREARVAELRAENAALTERLRVAEERIARVEALQAKAPYGLFSYGISDKYAQGIADYAKLLRAALAPTSDAAPKEAM